MGYSNELDRTPVRGVNPNKMIPMGSKLIVKRKLGDVAKNGLYIPENAKARRPTFEGTVVAVGANPPEECRDLRPGNEVAFSYQVGGDDSAFLVWEGAHYAVIPFDAVQLVLA